jgi:hypothetical protein
MPPLTQQELYDNIRRDRDMKEERALRKKARQAMKKEN